MIFGITREAVAQREMEYGLQGAALQATANAIIITDREGVVLWANPAFEKLTGYTSDEIIGHTPRLWKSGVQDTAFYSGLWQTILDGRVWRGELVNQRKDGSLYTEEMTVTPVMDDFGVPAYFIAVKQDITERKCYEQALAESERFVTAALNGLSEHIAIIDETGAILAVNAAWRRFATANGADVAGVCEGQNYLHVCEQAAGQSAEGAAEFARAIRAVLAGEQELYEQEYPCHSPDEPRWFLGRVTRFPGPGPARAIVTHETITQRKLAEQAQQIANRRLQALNEVIAFAASNREPMALLHRASQEMARVFDVDRGFAGFIDPKTNVALICNDDADPGNRAEWSDIVDASSPIYTRFVHNSQTLVVEDMASSALLQPFREMLAGWGATSVMITPLYVRRKPAGALVFVDRRHGVFGTEEISLAESAAQTLAQALEDRRLHEEIAAHNTRLAELVNERTRDLAALNRRTTTILNNASDAILLLGPGNAILSANKACEEKLGYTESELLNQPVSLLVEPHNVGRLMEAVESLSPESHRRHLTMEALRKDGNLLDADFALAYAPGDERRTVCSVRDISHFRAAERMRQQFISTVNHELRNPVAAISLLASSTARHYDRMTDDQRRQQIEQISDQAKVLTEILNGILEISRLDARRQESGHAEVPMKAMLQSVALELKPTVNSRRQVLRLHHDGREHTLMGEAVDFRIIWRNLLGNANKYTPKGGAIDAYMGCATKTEDGSITAEPPLFAEGLAAPDKLPPGRYLVGQVRDTGPGIPPEDRDQLFTRFVRGWAQNSSIPGTGLGLPLVRDILSAYGGEIAVHSEPRAGSTFSFWLPAGKVKDGCGAE